MTKPEMVLVPREPTREMWAASANALVKDRSWLNIAPDFVTEACYTAMLAAAPPAPSSPAGEWTVSDTELAKKICSYLGQATSPSLDPGDRIVDHIAALIAAPRNAR